ncbi:hypothetical protein ODJ80_10455, partial [Acutalibacter sp. LFL-21]|uniref:hypothetical protein n=1 Tax=Acutalibacter sp. LFL-21 TaxID=2983399 RepID=UPI0021D6606A
ALDFLRSLPAFLSPYTIIPHFLSQYEKKGHQKVTFFDRLKGPPVYRESPCCFRILVNNFIE